jgi:DNA-binding transcriptional ArsR family regulator
VFRSFKEAGLWHGAVPLGCRLLQEPLGKAQPTVSHHTRILADTGLITGEKRGRWVWSSVVPDRLDQLRSALAR